MASEQGNFYNKYSRVTIVIEFWTTNNYSVTNFFISRFHSLFSPLFFGIHSVFFSLVYQSCFSLPHLFLTVHIIGKKKLLTLQQMHKILIHLLSILLTHPLFLSYYWFIYLNFLFFVLLKVLMIISWMVI